MCWGISSIITKMPVGSRITCNPAPTDTDEDWLCLVSNLDDFHNQGLAAGFKVDGSLNGGVVATRNHNDSCKHGMFLSLSRTDHLNLIGTSDCEFFRRFSLGTGVAKALNLLDKRDRITLFQAILYSRFDR